MILIIDDKNSSEIPKNTDSGGFFLVEEFVPIKPYAIIKV